MLDPQILALADNELVIEVGSRMWDASESGLNGLSREEFVVLCVYVLEAEVNNGGFEQFFENSSGDLGLETPGALDAIGASKAGEIVRKALAEFGVAGPSPNRDDRIGEIEGFGDRAIQHWNELDQEFYGYPDDLAALLAAYIRKNANAIRKIESAKAESD